MDKKRCKESVHYSGGWHPRTCSRYAIRDGYCKIHHPEAVAKRKEEAKARYEQKWANSPYMHMERLQAEVERLRAVVNEIFLVAETGIMPDGDHLPVGVQDWLLRTIEEEA